MAKETGSKGPSGRGNRRPTKAERREEARTQREEIQRRMARQRKTRWVGSAVGVVVAAAIVVGLFLYQRGTAAPRPDELLARADRASETAGCTPVENVGPFDPESQDQSHIGTEPILQMPGLSTYPSVPPASGPHNDTPLPAGAYDSPPAIDQVIHSFEHGAVAIWYDPAAAGEEVEDLENFFFGGPDAGDPQGGAKVIVAPYSYPDQGETGQLPAGAGMVLAAWHNVQECASPSLAAAYDFVARYRTPPSSGRPSASEAPEPQAGI